MSTRSISEVIDDIGFGRAQVYTTILAHGIWIADATEVTMVTVVTQAIDKEFGLNDAQLASLASIVFVGLAVGATISGYVGDRMGRRIPIISCYLGVAILAVVSAFMWNFVSLLVVRFLLGIVMALGMPVSLTLVSEMSPKAWRVALMGARGIVFAMGGLLACIIVVIDNPGLKGLHWRVDVALSAIPSFVFGTLAFFFLQESAVFLADKGQHARAKEVLEWMRDKNSSACTDLAYETDAPAGLEEQSKGRAPLPWRAQMSVIFGPRQVYSTLFICMGVFTVNLVEYGTAYAEPRVFQGTHASLVAGLQLALKYLINIPLRVIVTCLVVVLGKKLSGILGFFFGNLVGLLLFAWMGSLEDRSSGLAFLYYLSQYLPLVGVAMTILVSYQFSVEAFPTSLRATGSGVAMAFSRIASIAAPYLFELVPGSWRNFYYILAGVSLFTGVLGLFIHSDMAVVAQMAQDDIDKMQPLKG